MKKVALFSLMVCCGMINNAFAGGCGPSVTLAYVGNQKPHNDEFLYINKTEYDKSVSGWENSSHYTSGDGHGYECDNSFCPMGHVVEMPAGHVFKNQVIDRPVKYQCWTAPYSPDGDDMWMPVNNGICKTKWGDLEVGKRFTNVKTTTDCSGLAKSEENVGLVKNWKVYCLETLGPGLICKPNECVEGYTVKNDKCVAEEKEQRDDQHDDRHDDHHDDVIVNGCTDDSQCPIGKKCMYVDGDKSIIGGAPMWADLKGGVCYDAEHIDCFRAAGLGDPTIWSGNPARCSCGKKNGIDYDWRPELRKCVAKGGNDTVVKSCKEKRTTAEGKACCDIPSNEAVWANNKCNCLNDKEFKMENGRGQCVDKNGSVVPGEESDCYYTFNVDINCSNGTKYTAGEKVKLTKEQAAQFGGCDATSARIQSVEDIIEKTQKEYKAAANLMLLICGSSSASVQPNGPSATELSDATRTLELFASNASSQASVWKDADGNFNTARLASDLTAGVVLGTVGGVVSGVVIKKKQVEKGFDALHCTVGGQKVADWGDTFKVGLQR